MASNWIGIVLGASLLLLLQGIESQYLYSNCGLSSSTSARIRNGENSGLGSAPFMAYIMKDNTYHCGGSIVNIRYVLTAAHCVNFGMTVRLGEYDDTSDPDCDGMVCMPVHQDFGIQFIAYHRRYNNSTFINDIALIRLNRNINFDNHIQPICLHHNRWDVPLVEEYKAYGWGLTSYDGSLSSVLQTTTLYPYPVSQCERIFNKQLNENQICAGSALSDTCSGDSGSPLVAVVKGNDDVHRFVQLGLVSIGSRQCIGYGAYTYIPYFGTWIFETIGILNKRFQ